MPDYSLGKIYKISSEIGNCCYYGSTTKPYLSARMAAHKYKYRTNNRPSASRIVLRYEDAKIELVEEYPCTNKYMLESRERWYIENNECVNIQIPCRTLEERYQKLQECKKRYRNSEHGKHMQQFNNMKYRLRQGLITQERFNEWLAIHRQMQHQYNEWLLEQQNQNNN